MNIFDAAVQTPKAEFEDNLSVWEQIDNFVRGAKWVKSQGTDYLPMPNPLDKSKKNLTRYEQYKTRALYMNATGRTLDAMVGMVFSKPPTIELPTDLEYLNTDADGNGLNLDQHIQGTLSEDCKKGRVGILVDFPKVEGQVTALDKQNGVRPYMAMYTAQNIINWRAKNYGAVNKLCLVVLREEQDLYNGVYESNLSYLYRVLWLDDEGYYNQAVMNVLTDSKTKKQIVTNEMSYQPTDANGNRFTEIPFRFIGSKNNDYEIDTAPLYDISEVNKTHYQNSADNQESSFLVGQPTLVIYTSKTEEELSQCNNGTGIQFGSRSGLILEEGDRAELLQASPNNLPKENMKDAESMMAQLGARLIFSGQQQTAEAARINYGAETAQLTTIVRNVESGYQDCIRWCSMFSTGNENPDFTIELNDNFFHEKMTAQELTAWLQLYQGAAISIDELLDKLRRSGEITESVSNQDIIEKLDTAEPSV
jgi:hypothetical protein